VGKASKEKWMRRLHRLEIAVAAQSQAWHTHPLLRMFGSLSITILFTVVGAMVKDLRWLLWVAGACACFPLWIASSNIIKPAWAILRIPIFALSIGLVGYALYALNGWIEPMPDEVASFHVIGSEVGFNSRNHNQLIANTYIHIDASEADIATYSFGGITKTPADEQQVINELRKIVLGLVKQGDGLHFTAQRNETKWFTVEGPILSDEQVQQYK
jgi:hypothetical protein